MTLHMRTVHRTKEPHPLALNSAGPANSFEKPETEIRNRKSIDVIFIQLKPSNHVHVLGHAPRANLVLACMRDMNSQPPSSPITPHPLLQRAATAGFRILLLVVSANATAEIDHSQQPYRRTGNTSTVSPVYNTISGNQHRRLGLSTNTS